MPAQGVGQGWALTGTTGDPWAECHSAEKLRDPETARGRAVGSAVDVFVSQVLGQAGLFTGKDVPSLVTWLVFWLELVLDRR